MPGAGNSFARLAGARWFLKRGHGSKGAKNLPGESVKSHRMQIFLVIYLPVVSTQRAIAHTCSISADHFARPPLAQSMLNLKMRANALAMADALVAHLLRLRGKIGVTPHFSGMIWRMINAAASAGVISTVLTRISG